MLLKMRLAFSAPDLEEEVLIDKLKAQSLVFEEIISGWIKPEHLNQCYVYAMQHRTLTFPLTPGELIEAKKSLVQSGAKPEKPRCIWCEFEEETEGKRKCSVHTKK